MSEYQFKWQEELKWAAITFLIYVGGAFVLTDQNPVNDWASWGQAVTLAGARAAVAGMINGLRALSAGRGV